MNGFTGNKSSFVRCWPSFLSEGRAAPGLSGAGVGLRTRMVAAGSTKSAFRSPGVDEYTVVATSVIPQLSRRSTKNAPAVYGVNWHMRDCNTDHSKIVSYRDQYGLARARRIMYRTGIARETLLMSERVLPTCPETCCVLSCL